MTLMLLGGSATTNGYTSNYSTLCLVDYTDVEGNDSRFESISQNIGRAGTANINSYTRAMTISRNDLSMSGNIMPASIGFNYCSAFDTLSNVVSRVESGEEPNNLYGRHWLPTYLNCILTIDESRYLYYNSQGSVVIFLKQENTVDGVTTTSFKDEKEETLGSSGYTLDLIDQSADISFENMKITNMNGETEYYNSNGMLTEIKESEPNEDGAYDSIIVSYVVDGHNNIIDPYKIHSITDGVGRKYVFNYTNDLLTSVVCQTAQGTTINAGSTETDLSTTYSYDTNGNLTGVTYPDGETVAYTYNADGYISSASNIDGYRINYTYDSLGKVTALTEQAYNGSQYINGNTIALSSLDSCQTKVTDAQGTSTVYQFDSDGALLYTFDEKGNYCKKGNYDLKLENNSIFSSGDWKISSHNLLKNPSFEAQSSINSSRAKYWNSEFTRLASENALSGNYVYSLAVTTDSIHMQNGLSVKMC